MPAIRDITRSIIKDYLHSFVSRLVEQHQQGKQKSSKKKSREGTYKPFHTAIIPSELLRISTFERSFSSSLGTTYEECARLIALDYHAIALRGYDVSASVNSAALAEIEKQVERFEHAAEEKSQQPNLHAMLQRVLDSPIDGQPRTIKSRADLYIKTHAGEELFFEMKSPVPNKGQCIEVTQRILRFHLLKREPPPKVQAYFALAYNPFGERRSDYHWSMTKLYTPFEDVVLIGRDFWEKIGAPGVYEELLDIYREIGQEKNKFIIDSLALGF